VRHQPPARDAALVCRATTNLVNEFETRWDRSSQRCQYRTLGLYGKNRCPPQAGQRVCALPFQSPQGSQIFM
jgi:hypothetical protein